MAIIPTGFKVRTRPDSPNFFVLFYVGGKRRRFSTTVPRDGDRKAAEREAAAIVFKVLQEAGACASGERPAVPAAVAEQLELRSVFAAWLDELELTARAHGRNPRYRSRLETDWIYIGDRFKRPSEITKTAWETWKLALHHSNGGPLKWQSIAHLANTIRHFLRYCVARDILQTMPEIKSPTLKDRKRDRAKKTAMDEYQREAFLWALAILGEARALRIYCTMFETWQRKRTTEHLAQSWCDFEQKTISIPGQYLKNGEEGVIHLTPIAAAAVLEEVEAREKELGRKLGADEPVFGHFDFHQTWDKEKRGGLFGRATALAGLWNPETELRPAGMDPHHSTRRSSATIAARNGASGVQMMAQGLWKSLQVLEESYLRPMLGDARAAAALGRSA